MENKQINQLMLAMAKTGISELVLEKEGFKLQLKRGDKAPVRGLEILGDTFEENPMQVDFEKHRQTVVATQPEAKKATLSAKEDENSLYVTSPMVGTFYYSPSPNDPPFVKAGDRVEKNTVVCIIEAMKVMNEIKAQVTGTVAEVLIENGSPVEFGTKIFRITPA
jgi:acetyl-CoA carboxylase biotin carboxyl carrier protein